MSFLRNFPLVVALGKIQKPRNAVKLIINNVKYYQNDKRKCYFHWTGKEILLLLERFYFCFSLFFFMLFVLCEMHSEIILVYLFEMSTIYLIYVADSTRASWTKFVFETACNYSQKVNIVFKV